MFNEFYRKYFKELLKINTELKEKFFFFYKIFKNNFSQINWIRLRMWYKVKTTQHNHLNLIENQHRLEKHIVHGYGR